MDDTDRSANAASDPFEARAQQRVEVLRELTAIGLEMAREVRRQLMEPVAEEAPAKDLSLMFARIARAVRQTAALAARLDQDRQKSRAETASKAAAEARLRGINRKLRVQDIVERVLDTESDRERLLERLDERLEAANDTDFTDRPIGELVAAICRDLGVTPDWGLWEDEDWAIEALAAEPAPPDQRPETYLRREAGEGDRSP